MRKNRFPDFPRGSDGKKLKGANGGNICRGCKTVEVPKNRKAWCSRACLERFHPWYVFRAAYQRDAGKCQMCSMVVSWPGMGMRAGARANFDHVVPFSEGGETIVENIRTLCEVCHKSRTSQWHKERAAKRKQHGTGNHCT